MSIPVLLVDKPGHLREAMVSLLGAMPIPLTLMLADTGLLALKALREIPPALVLIGSGLADAEVVELVQQVKLAQPKLSCLVLTDKSSLQQSVLAAGADGSLPANQPGGQMFAAIQHLLDVQVDLR